MYPHCRILVIDDNCDVADALGMMLSIEGHTVQIANSGHEALALADRYVPDIAFLDIGMPEMDGYEVAGLLREKLSAKPPLLVALSGYGSALDRERSRAAGFDAHVTKPLDISKLRDLVDQACSTQSSRTRQ